MTNAHRQDLPPESAMTPKSIGHGPWTRDQTTFSSPTPTKSEEGLVPGPNSLVPCPWSWLMVGWFGSVDAFCWVVLILVNADSAQHDQHPNPTHKQPTSRPTKHREEKLSSNGRESGGRSWRWFVLGPWSWPLGGLTGWLLVGFWLGGWPCWRCHRFLHTSKDSASTSDQPPNTNQQPTKSKYQGPNDLCSLLVGRCCLLD